MDTQIFSMKTTHPLKDTPKLKNKQAEDYLFISEGDQYELENYVPVRLTNVGGTPNMYVCNFRLWAP